MLFPTHLVAAYLLGRWRGLPILPIVVGAAIPDLIDKPLAMVGIADLHHTIGHSLIAVVVLGVLAVRGRRWFALWVGWTSHLALDALQMIVNGRPGDVRFLLWPFVRHVPVVDLPPVEFAMFYVGTPAFFLEVALWIGFLAIHLGDRSADPGDQ